MYELDFVGRRSLLLQTGALLVAGCGGNDSRTPTNLISVPKTVCPITLVPAYFYKAFPWMQLAATGQSIVVIANANNGPGSSLDRVYKTWIDAVRNTGNRVKGYVSTRYGLRAAPAVSADMDAWSQMYDLNDFFLDEVSCKAADLTYYATLLSRASAANPHRRFMLNPGAPPDVAYFSLLPGIEMLVFENQWASFGSSNLPSELDPFASQCWIMGLSASRTDMLQIATVARNRGFAGFFATDVPYTAGLPTYWDSERELAICT